jgi:hypothetical protein
LRNLGLLKESILASVTIVINHFDVDGRFQARYGTITMSNSYLTGGDTITAAAMGLDRCINFNVGNGVNTSNTAQMFDLVPNTTSSFQTAKVQIFGDGGNNPGGPELEAANGTNNSTIVANFWAIGF